MLRLTPRLVTVNRATFSAQLWRMRGNNYVREIKYEIAIGRIGYETPAGMYFVERKDKNPTWLPPDSDWVTADMRDKQGHPLPLGPDDPKNPIKARFIALSGGKAVGFHGTAATDSIGTAASHGCLRMRVPDVIDLFKRVSLGTPVFIYGGKR